MVKFWFVFGLLLVGSRGWRCAPVRTQACLVVQADRTSARRPSSISFVDTRPTVCTHALTYLPLGAPVQVPTEDDGQGAERLVVLVLVDEAQDLMAVQWLLVLLDWRGGGIEQWLVRNGCNGGDSDASCVHS